MDERPIRKKLWGLVVGAVCVELALASCAGDYGGASGDAPPAGARDAGGGPKPAPTWDASADAGHSREDASSAHADAAVKPSVFLPSASWIAASTAGSQRERWSPPADAIDTGPTDTLASSSTMIAIDIAQAEDPGDQSYTWYENVDDDLEDEVCTSVDDDETGYRYAFCERFSDECDDGSQFEGVLLVEFAPDDTYTVVFFGADLCGSGHDAPACSYDAAGNELSCGIWFGAVVEPVEAI